VDRHHADDGEAAQDVERVRTTERRCTLLGSFGGQPGLPLHHARSVVSHLQAETIEARPVVSKPKPFFTLTSG
jgi:hypothetical protein